MLRLGLFLSVIFLAFPVLSHAGLIITVDDAVVNPGGTAFVDVFIESTGSDLLQAFGFEFNITTGGPTRLEFVSPQPDPQLIDSSYVFFGDSFDQINAFPVGTVSTASLPNDTFIGGDSTDSFADVNVTSSRLLARLEVTAATALPPVAGDTFSVTFDDTSFNTFFFDSSFNPLTIDPLLSDFTGTVTVTPEPSSLLLPFGGMMGGYCLNSRRRRRAKRQECASRFPEMG